MRHADLQCRRSLSPTKSSPRYRYCIRFAVMRRLPSSPTMRILPPFSPRSVAEPKVTSAIPWRPILRCRPFRSSCTAAPIFRRPPSWPARPSALRRPSNTDNLNFPRSNRFRGLNNRRRRRLSGRRTAFTNSKPPFSTTRQSACRVDHGFNGGRHTPEFTERQYAVLVCLCQGDPNKVIGRKLGMTETTVKVHVREIMRKLGVSNRTQVAIAAAHVCADGAVELVPADSSMAIRSSISH